MQIFDACRLTPIGIKMQLELINGALTIVSFLFVVGYHMGKLNSRIDRVEKLLERIENELVEKNVIRISDFKRSK